MMKRALSPLAAACLLAIAAPQASAAAYSGMVVFGDSLSDAGQFGIRFTTQTGPVYGLGASGVYGNTSPMFINDMLGFGPQRPSTSPLAPSVNGDNWAVGG